MLGNIQAVIVDSQSFLHTRKSDAQSHCAFSVIDYFAVNRADVAKVLGVQNCSWDERSDYVGQIAPCRTFCFFHELEYLASLGLVKGGDVDNAIVIVEHPVSEEQIGKMCSLFGQPRLSVTEQGYLSNITLHFPNECGRHKMLDLIGDIRLVGGYPKAHVSAYKPGHKINSTAAKAVLSNR